MHKTLIYQLGKILLPLLALCLLTSSVGKAETFSSERSISNSANLQTGPAPAGIKKTLMNWFQKNEATSPSYASQHATTFGASPRDYDITSDDYLQDIAGDGLYQWPPDKLPVRVYIESSTSVPGYKPYFQDILRSAFDEWVQASHGRLGWVEVFDKSAADIICQWTDQVTERTDGTEAARTKTYTRFNTQTNRGTISRATMLFLTRLPERVFSSDELRRTCLHEVGHVFGLAGHSPQRGDVMFAAVPRVSNPHLSNRDVSTINKLYQQYSQLGGLARAIPSAMPPRT